MFSSTWAQGGGNFRALFARMFCCKIFTLSATTALCRPLHQRHQLRD